MDSVLRLTLEPIMAFLRSMDERQMDYLRSMDVRQMDYLKSIKEEQTSFLTSMNNLQTFRDERQTGLLTSIDERLAKLNPSDLNKVEVEGVVKNGKREENVTKINEEVMCDNYVKQLHESSAPWPSSCISRTEGKKYRLHIVGEVCHEAIGEDSTVTKMNVIKGKPLEHIEVILKHGDEQVPASHHLASLRVELVVLDAKCYFEQSTDWPQKEFEDHLMPAAKNSVDRMTVDRGIFSLDGGRKVCTVASIKQSSWKQKVRLGVMVVQDGSVQERVLEGVSSNEFYVIHGRRREATCANKDSKRQATGNSELNSNGKRVNSDTTLQPRTSHSQFSGHAQNPQKFGQHGTGEQPSHVRNACSTQNCPTAPINAGYIGRAVPSQSYAPNSDQGLPACVQKKLDGNDGIPSEESHGDLSSQNPMMFPGKRVHINDTTLQSSAASYSQFSGHVQRPQKIGQHAMGKQPSHAPNDRPTTPIGNIRGAVPPQAFAPNPNAASVHMNLGDNQSISFEEVYQWPMNEKTDDNQGRVDPSSQVGINLQGQQTLMGQFGDMLQQGGSQGQPVTPHPNNLHTSSQGHTTTTAATTDDVTSAQDDLDDGMGGHEQGHGGRIGIGDYGDDIFGQLKDVFSRCNEDSV